MEEANPFIYLELLASLVATGLALRSKRFWICFPLGLLGAALLFDSGFSSWGGVYRRSDPIVAIAVFLGASLFVIGLLGRKRGIGPLLALLGLHLLLFALAFLADVLTDMALAATGLALLLIAAFSPRLPWGPLLAILGWFSVSLPLGIFYNSQSIDSFHAPRDLGPYLVLAPVFIALIWLAPNRAWTRMAFLAMLLLVLPVYRFLLQGYTGSFEGSAHFPRSLFVVATALGGGILMGLLRNRLFEEDLVQLPVETATARATPSPAHQSTAQPRPVTPHTPADIFISYKREERARVEAIAKALRELKLSVWFDARLQSGHSFDDEINREVRAAKCVLVCWSPGASASEWVRAEASIGRQRGVLAACFLEPCELHPPFNLVHAEDLSHGAPNAANPAWVNIVEQIGHLVGRPGLGAFLAAGGDRAALGAWLADHASDPLADATLARLRQT